MRPSIYVYTQLYENLLYVVRSGVRTSALT